MKKNMVLSISLILCLLFAFLSGCQKKCEHQYAEEITKEASCTAVGQKKFTCTLCGESYEEEIPVAEHSYDDGVIQKEATCSEEGEILLTCTACGETKLEAIEKAVHSFDEGTVTKEPTCVELGEKTVTCAVCGAVENVTIEKAEHSFDEGTVTKNPTCVELGERTVTCTACGESKTVEVEKVDHSYGDGKVTSNPTCVQAGVKTFTCSVCRQTRTEEVAAVGHSYTSTVTVQASCTQNGKKTFTCSRCGNSYDETISATEHEYGLYQILEERTCTKDGKFEMKCINCGDSYTETEKGGHNWVEATCTEAKHCARCNQTEGAALGHTTTNGTCSRCHKEITDGCTLTLPALPSAHRYIYSYGFGTVYQSGDFTIDNVTYKFSKNSDGSWSLRIQLYGVVGTVHREGGFFRFACAISNGTGTYREETMFSAYSGNVFTCEVYFENILPGNYALTLENIIE